jgi:copper ion binding protein
MIKMKKTMSIEGMTCEHCAGRVKEVLQKVNGVKKVKVKLKKNTADITVDDSVTEDTLVKAVSEAGYKATIK